MVSKEEILKKWEDFARKYNLELNNSVDLDLKANTCAKYNGACICLPKWRTSCPLQGCLEDIEISGACYCLVFKKRGITINYDKHSQMTKKIREKFGI